ncbi:MAG: hypothetical protein Q8R25_04225 [bacterium]|nr:hypothetical protein [bacterium]
MLTTGVRDMRVSRLALLLTYLAALCGSAGMAWAQNPGSGVAEERVVSRNELYYYDENKLRKPLALSRSIAVRFQNWKSPEEKDLYLKQFGPVTIRQIAQLYSRAEFALDYMPTQNQDARAATVRRLTADGEIDITPIFTVDGMDAVVDGIYIQTVTPMSRETVLRALEKHFGNGIGVHEVTPQGGLWHVSFKKLFFLNGERLPLTVLSIANVLQTSDTFVWVKRAYPKFAFLDTPVIPSISVYPVSGTVGEERTVVIGFRIFGKTSSDVVIEDSDIPEFMAGSFVPMSGGKPPQPSFIEVFGSKVVEKLRQVGPNEWYFEHRYTFFLGAPELEWVFPAFKIPYMYRGVRNEMTIPATTFFVRPHLDEKFALQDIPQAFKLPVRDFPGFTEVLPTPTRAWFDPVADLVGGRDSVETSAKIALGSSILIALLCFVALTVRTVTKRWSAYAQRGLVGARLALLLKQAEGMLDQHAAFQAYHGALSEVLHTWDPKFPRSNVTYQDVKSRLGAIRGGALLKHLEDAIGIEDVFSEIESRNEESFSARDKNELNALRTNLRLKIEKLAAELAKAPRAERRQS